MSLLAELKRRNVFRLGLFYIVSSWVLLQIADLVFELLLVPDWTLRFIFGALLVSLTAQILMETVEQHLPINKGDFEAIVQRNIWRNP